MSVLRLGPLFIVVALVVEALSHVGGEQSRFVWVPGAAAIFLISQWLLLRKIDVPLRYAGALLLLPWLAIVIVMLQHISVGVIQPTIVFMAISMIAVGALMMPLWPLLVALASSSVIVLWLEFVIAQENASVSLLVLVLTLSVATLVYRVRRRAIVNEVGRRSAQLELEQQRLQMANAQQKLALSTNMAGGIAHRLNNDLQTIVIGLENALRLLPDHPATSLLNHALHSGENAAELVKKLHIHTGKMVSESEIFDIEQLLEEAVLRSHLPEQADLFLSFTGLPIQLNGNFEDLRTSILALVHNAGLALPDGNGSVLVRASATDDVVRIEVSDDGVGIADEEISRVMEPFYTSEPIARDGLGLAVVDGIVRRHGGSVSIRSDKERGTRVSLELPRSKTDTSERVACG
ncbi:MAG: HAMP domain-containing histidine kinase [Pseudomonadaceae bacterium]|nr:HAMP domain-containing histidine kinase [Pseudomonadaceae bacterium]